MPTARRTGAWSRPLALLGGTTAVVVLALLATDWILWSPEGVKPGFLTTFVSYDAAGAQQSVSNMAQLVAAALGIVVTVVSIVVQLAAMCMCRPMLGLRVERLWNLRASRHNPPPASPALCRRKRRGWVQRLTHQIHW